MILSDGVSTRHVELGQRPEEDFIFGLWVKSGAWRELSNFEAGTVLLILSDTLYEDAEYVRNWPDFLERVGRG